MYADGRTHDPAPQFPEGCLLEMSDELRTDLPQASPDAPVLAPASVEHRRHSRIPIKLSVDYRRTNSFLADYTRNISRGGTFIVTDRPLAVGTLFRFTLTVPTPPASFELVGEVVWARSDGAEPGMGIRFVYDTDEERQRTEDAMARILVENLGPALAERLLSLGPTRK